MEEKNSMKVVVHTLLIPSFRCKVIKVSKVGVGRKQTPSINKVRFDTRQTFKEMDSDIKALEKTFAFMKYVKK